MALILKNAHVVDPSVELDGIMDVLIEDGKIARVGEGIEAEGAEPAIISYEDVKKCTLKPVIDFKGGKGDK